eukprot:TRINITY_DN2694_c0_g1_i1.p2 TRINITY_DN2694_c0_g1~~TRINITY_DN2694_c0_g1_i1.p2  ORF type:complete len:1567 (-),score=429.12 TRINITY_DN2694_c0_g1_i1:66767-71467(-)
MASRPVRIFLKIALAAVALAVLLVGGVFIALQTGPVKRAIVSFAADAVAEQMHLEIDGLSGLLPLSIKLDKVAIAESEHTAPWLIVQDMVLEWSPLDLVTGNLHVDQFGAERVILAGLPPASEKEPAPKEQGPIWPPPSLSLPNVQVDALRIEHFILTSDVVKNGVMYAIYGNARIGGGQADVNFEVTRPNFPKNAIKAVIATRGVDTDSPELDVDIEVQEPPDELLATFTDINQTAPIHLVLKGEGPLSAWTGSLNATHGNESLVGLDLSLGVAKESLSFGVNGAIYTTPLVGGDDTPGLVGPMLGDKEREAVRGLGESVDLALDGRALVDDSGDVLGLELAKADVTAGSLGVEAKGRLGKSLKDVELDALAHVEDLSVVNVLLDQSLEGSLVLSAAISRKDNAMQGHTELAVEDFAFGEYRAGNATVDLQLDPLQEDANWTEASDTAMLPPVRGELVVDVDGLAVPPGMESVVQAVGDSPRITGAFRTVDSRTIQVERMDLGAIAAQVSMKGQVSLDGPAKAQVELVAADLQSATEAFGMEEAGLDGSMTLNIDFDGDWNDPSGKLIFNAQTEGLVVDAPGAANATGANQQSATSQGSMPPGALAAVLGSDPTLTGEAVLEPSGALQVSSLTAQAKAFSLTASAKAHLKDAQAPLSANVDLKAESLQPFSALAGTELGGALNVSVQGSGDMGAPDLTLKLTIDEPRVGAQTFDKLSVNVNGSGPLETWSGEAAVDLAATLDGQPAELGVDTQFALGQDQVALQKLAISGPGVSLNGDITLHSASGVVTGSLAGGAEDLSRIGAFAGVDLAGSLQANIVLKDEDGQGVDLTASLGNVQAPGASVDSVQIEAQLTDLTATPQGTARVDVTGVDAEGFDADTVTLTADGSGEGMDIALKIDGGNIEAGAEPAPLELALAGNLQPPGEKPLSFRLTKLSGSLDDRPLALEQPGGVTMDAGNLSIEPVAIGWGDAGLAVQGGWDGNQADLSLKVSDLSADSVMLLIGNEPVGPEAVLSLELNLSGPMAKPTATVNATAQGVRMRVAEDSPLTAMDEFNVNVDARVEGGALDTTVAVEGLKDSRVNLEASLPATFSLQPFAFELPPDGQLSGSLQADAQLASFEPLLAFYGIQASGEFDSNFTLEGTLSSPKADGKAVISNGRIEYVETGSVVTGLDLEFVAAQSPESDSPRLIINLTANDGEKGAVQMSGWVDVDPERATPFRINVALSKFTAVRMDVLRLAATGDAALEGDMEESRIVGGLSLAPVQVWLPESLPPDVVDVEVVNVRTLNKVDGEEQEKIIDTPDSEGNDEQPAEPAAFDPKLELGVEVKEGMRVQGLGVDTTWKGRLDVGGRLTAPKLTGNVQVTEGDIEFLSKEFVIRKGSLNFWGQVPPSPRVDVEATTDAGDVKAIVKVYGMANSPQFSLASEPSRPRDEILSYILFGQDMNRISPIQAVKIAQTAAMLASGSDFLSIQRNASKIPLLGGLDIGLTDNDEGGAVQVGTEVVKGVNVSVEEGLGESSTQVEVEVEVSRQFSVSGSVDDKGDQSVGFDWRLDYQSRRSTLSEGLIA